MNSRYLLSEANAREYYEYITRLAGGSLSRKDLLLYAEKLLEVIDVVEKWRADRDLVERFYNDGREIFPKYLWKKHANFYKMTAGLEAAITERHVNSIREIFNDPNGKYLLRWDDFCHTGRKELILIPIALRYCAMGLICLITEQEAQETTVR